MEEKILTRDEVIKLGLDKVQVITADMLEGYTSIEECAFGECNSLLSIEIPDSVIIIGNEAFDACTSLTSVVIPNSITNIAVGTFYNCSHLTSIKIPNSITSIGGHAFFGCTNLISITIPNSVISIGEHAFGRCPSLTSVTIPNSVTRIGNMAFLDCTGLTSIDVASGNLNYCSEDGVLFNKDKTTLIQYPGGKQGAYTIPNSVTSIGSGAFFGCTGLTSVTIPNSVISIEDYAFEGCNSLISIEISDSITNIGNFAFNGCTSLISIIILNYITNIGECAFMGCDSLISITFGDKTYKEQTMTDGKYKAYKAFNADMTCREFQYEEGKTYELDRKPILCEQGFHACLNLSDVFNYYSGKLGKDIHIHEVELENISDERHNDSKVVAKKITIGKRIL